MTELAEAPPRTPAQQEAELLFPLARHLAGHPDLPPVDVYPVAPEELAADTAPHPVTARCHLTSYGPYRASGLAAWADSLTEVTITARLVPAHWLNADVFVTGLLDDVHCITVWAEINGFSTAANLLSAADPRGVTVITTAQLRDCAATDPAPCVGDLLAPPDPDAAGDDHAVA